jgi:hypothetical protein
MAHDVYPPPIHPVHTILSLFHGLLHQAESLSSLLQQPSIGGRETNIVLCFLKTINNNASTFLAQLQTFKIPNNIKLSPFTTLLASISTFHNSLWRQLSYPHITAAQDHLYTLLVALEQILLTRTNKEIEQGAQNRRSR